MIPKHMDSDFGSSSFGVSGARTVEILPRQLFWVLENLASIVPELLPAYYKPLHEVCAQVCGVSCTLDKEPEYNSLASLTKCD